MADVTNPFAVDTIGSAINEEPNRFSRLGQLGLFTAMPQATTEVTLLYRDERVTLLDPQARGSERQELNRERPNSKSFSIPHFPFGDVITPMDIQNVTAFQPGPRQLETMAAAVSRRLAKVREPHDQTFEFYRLGALKGNIENPDGTTLYNLHDIFGIPRPEFEMPLNDPDGDIFGVLEDISDYIGNNARGETVTAITLLAGKTFTRRFKRHPKYEKYLLNHSAALQQIAASRVNKDGPVGGRRIAADDVMIESYDAKWTNSAGNLVQPIGDNEAYVMLEGTDDLYHEYDAPPNRTDAVNMAPSQDIAVYPKELDQAKGTDLDTESNKLCLTTRPKLCVRITMDAE